MKSTILLTTALFLASAPSPDSKAVSDLSAGFLSTGANHSLMAAEPTLHTPFNNDASSQLSDQSAAEDHVVAPVMSPEKKQL